MNPLPKTQYIQHRLHRAQETFEEAQMLFEGEHLSGAVNRIYYAMFYAVSALALSHDFKTSSHTQLRGYFNREFVKTGIVPLELGKAYNLAFENRTKGDYTDLTTFEREKVSQMLQDAETFINTLTTLCKSIEPEEDLSETFEESDRSIQSSYRGEH